MKQGVWSHICGVIRISAMRKYKDMKPTIKYKINQAPSIRGDNGTTVTIRLIEDPIDKLIKVDPAIEDYRATVVIIGDLENVSREEARKMYDEFVRYLMTEFRIIQKASTIIDNDRVRRRPSAGDSFE